MRKTSLFSLALALAVALLSVVSTAAPTRAQSSQSIMDVAAANTDLTILTAAVKAAGLDTALSKGGPFTVFAPTDEAFTAALTTLGLSQDQLLANKPLLTAILLYHVVPGTFSAKTILSGNGALLATGLIGTSLRISVNGSDVVINNAKVLTTDMTASNGVIHTVDTVLLPNPAIKVVAPLKAGTKTILALAASNTSLKSLVAAIGVSTDVGTFLSQDGPYTVFAPNDSAFGSAAKSLGMTADKLLTLQNLPDILNYHIVPFAYPAVALIQLNGAWLGTVLPDQYLTVTVKSGKVLINNANVITPDLSATNGIIHGIDSVLLPTVKVAVTPTK